MIARVVTDRSELDRPSRASLWRFDHFHRFAVIAWIWNPRTRALPVDDPLEPA
jgi:hypothetical protein